MNAPSKEFSALSRADVIASPHLQPPSPAEYFAKLVDENRRAHVVRAAEGFIHTSKDLASLDFSDFWAPLNEVLGEKEFHRASKVKQLEVARRRIKKLNRFRKYEIAEHIAHLFFWHMTEYYKPLVNTRQGFSQLSAVFEVFAQHLGTTHQDVQARYRNCKKYKYLLDKGGSGSFMILGSLVTSL
jgi:hypothetical protein